MHPVDLLLRTQILPDAKLHGFTRKGRSYYLVNSNNDIVIIGFSAIGTSGVAVNVVLDQGLDRLMIHGDNPPNAHPGSGIWQWLPEVPVQFRDIDDPVIWVGIGNPQVGQAIGDAWRNSWLPTMVEIIHPGAVTKEIRNPSNLYPGTFNRSEADLARSALNDGHHSPESIDVLIEQLSTHRPRVGLWYQNHFQRCGQR